MKSDKQDKDNWWLYFVKFNFLFEKLSLIQSCYSASVQIIFLSVEKSG